MSAVRKQSDEAAALNANSLLIDALLGGTVAMRAAGATYMPKQPNEDEEDWKYRLANAVLYPAFERTVEVLAGKPFSKKLDLGADVPARIAAWQDNIDLQGNSLHTFAASICEETISHGFSGILVDFPKAVGLKTKADEKAAGVRPYFVHIHPQNVLGWESEVINGVEEFTQLRLLESAKEKTDEFTQTTVPQVRVLYRGKWQTWRKSKVMATRDEWALHEEGGSLPRIPFVASYGKRKGFMCSKPPLMALAEQNSKHWRESSDQDDSVRFARKRMLVLIGLDNSDPLTISSNAAVKLPTGADAKVVQGSAEAVKIGRDELNTLEEQMRQSGAEMMVIRPGKITATQTASEGEGNMCALQRIANDLDKCIEQALQFMADWIVEPKGGTVTIFKDFGAATLDEVSADLLFKATVAGKMSNESLHEEFQRRGIRSADVDWEAEKKRIESDRASDEPPTFDVPMPKTPPKPGPPPGTKPEPEPVPPA
ncbi:DUF4055 domain-containing protein [Massilia sp. CCM 8734]|uniref:DUF4055 domain-containing protein n=1 Tax=Massilia sp. CCM 8734 TaxID=2609283 RepID=UPI00142368B8|nr:DUF4055 domain-containing protein [Massilia sp. CCM 8734]NHZ94564.1 DUF4055 domain-containing protein [Massilia sp. CCM 8734]